MKLYELLQKHAVCEADPTTGTFTLDSGPFCTSYHIRASQDSVEDTATEAAQEKLKSQFRSSMYFFLQNTMQEFPFAWWHQCILLQSRGISSQDVSLTCREWMDESISEKQMTEVYGLYDNQDVRGTILRIKGGITSAVLTSAIQSLTETLKKEMESFSNSGMVDENQIGPTIDYILSLIPAVDRAAAEATIRSTSPLHVGAPRNYNLKCYGKGFLPPTKDQFLTMGKGEGTECPMNMLMWVNNEDADYTRFDTKNSYPEQGRPGIQKECFVYREKDIVSMSSYGMKGAFDYLWDRFEGNSFWKKQYVATAQNSTFKKKMDAFLSSGGQNSGDSLLSKGLELNDFFNHKFNSHSSGMLAAEFVPPEIGGLPDNMPDFSQVDGSIITSHTDFDSLLNEVPCVTLKDMESLLPECRPEKEDPVPLDVLDCEDAYKNAISDLEDYANVIENSPFKPTTHAWPAPPLECIWDCGGYFWDGYDNVLHTGLDAEIKLGFEDQLDQWLIQCKKIATDN